MDKQNLNFFGIFVLLIVIVLGIFVWAAATPTNVTFEVNTTNNYDQEGIFTVNWTVTGETAISHLIYFNLDGGGYVTAANNSATGYSFSNITEGNYTFIVEAENVTNAKTNASLVWMIVDTTNPVVSYITGTPADNAFSNTLTSIFVNVSVTEANNDSLVFSLYNSTSLVNETVYLTSTTLNINFTGLPVNVVYRYNVTVNDSATRSFTAATRTFTLDNVAPSPSLTKISSGQTSLELSISGKEGTCTVDRSGATVSGSTVTETGLSCGNSYSYIVTCTDSAGNVGSSSATSFSTTGCGSSVSGGTSSQSNKASYSFSKITPGNVSIMKSFDAEIGVKVIQIQVNNNAQNVKITVTKYDNKPAEVSVEKTGKVYQYLQIAATNLGNNLDKAIVQFKVEKSWISSNGLNKDKISVFKFNENSKEWNELLTVYNSSDNTYDFFDVELTSFSFFAISEKTVVVVEDEDEASLANGETSTTGGTEKKGNLKWLWIVVVVLVILFVVAIMNREKLIWFEK